MVDDCVFCKISDKKIPGYFVDENSRFFAIMDVFPPTFSGKVTMPTVLVITKEHEDSNIFENMDEQLYSDMMLYSKRIAVAMQRALSPERVCMIYEGMEIAHAHVKLYAVFKDSYPGYLSSKKSEDNKSVMADDKMLFDYAAKIRSELKNV